MDTSKPLFLGTRGQVVAFDPIGGNILWRAKLKTGLGGYGFVTLLARGDLLFAHTGGELFCLDSKTGNLLWKDGLEGMGFDLACLAIDGASAPSSDVIAAIHQRRHSSNSNASSSSSSSSGS